MGLQCRAEGSPERDEADVASRHGERAEQAWRSVRRVDFFYSFNQQYHRLCTDGDEVPHHHCRP